MITKSYWFTLNLADDLQVKAKGGITDDPQRFVNWQKRKGTESRGSSVILNVKTRKPELVDRKDSVIQHQRQVFSQRESYIYRLGFNSYSYLDLLTKIVKSDKTKKKCECEYI